eukprot:9816933-Alexandrium_andersonii.AAC.1
MAGDLDPRRHLMGQHNRMLPQHGAVGGLIVKRQGHEVGFQQALEAALDQPSKVSSQVARSRPAVA